MPSATAAPPGKIKMSALRRLAQDAGYDGKKADAQAMLDYLADEGWSPVIAGKALDAASVKRLQVEMAEDEMSVLVTQSDGGGEEPPADDGGGEETRSLPRDINQLIDAKVNERMKQMGMLDGAGKARPTLGVQSVKTAAEVIWENRAARGQTAFKSYDQCHGAGLYLRSLVLGSQSACKNLGEAFSLDRAQKSLAKYNEWADRAHGKAYTTVNTPAVVPDAFLADLIRLVEEVGVARRIARMIPMATQSLTIPRRTGGLTGYYPAEGGAATDSEATYDDVSLRARTFVVNATVSREILQDSGLAFADITFEEMAYTIALKEDDAIINGDGTSTYGGIRGLADRFGSTIGATGQDVTGGDTALAHDEADLSEFMGRVPNYARNGMIFLTSPELASIIFDRLGAVGGGTSAGELAGWGYVTMYRNVPIIPITTMPATADASGDRIDVYGGNLSRGIAFGDRQAVELASDDSVKFKENAVALRGVVRHDINVHDIGDNTNAGPIVALWQT